MTVFIGDIHGTAHDTKAFSPYFMPARSVQVGDLNLVGYDSWPGCDDSRFFIDGNHDYFPSLDVDADTVQEVKRGLMYVPRAYLHKSNKGNVLFIGGAESPDKQIRTPGYDWYPDESLNLKQFNRACAHDRVDVVISHCPPTSALYHLCCAVYPTSTSQGLEELCEMFKPPLWIFGHMHKSKTFKIYSTEFVSLGIMERKELPVDLVGLGKDDG